MTHPLIRTHPFDLPEVRNHVAQFLTLHDLTICSRVSQDWSLTCVPLLWRKLSIASSSSSGKFVDKASIRRYSRHVKTLNCGGFFGTTSEPNAAGVSDVHFRNLEDLTRNTPPQDQAKFIYSHRLTLVRLDLSCMTTRSKQGHLESNVLWSVIAACPKLKTLKIDRVSVTHRTWPLCWSLWSRLDHLCLGHIDFLPLLAAGAFDKPKETIQDAISTRPGNMTEWLSQASPCQLPLKTKILDLFHRPDMTRLRDELALLRYCPDLETLIWHVTSNKFTAEQVGQYLAEQTRHCPKLSSVTVHFASKTEVAGPFLETKVGAPLQELGWPIGFFSQAAWNLVKTKYATTLQSLDLWDAHVPNGLAHNILYSLPNLVSLSIRHLNDSDIRSYPRNWVCSNLQYLMVGINVVGYPVEGHNTIMRRLGTLESLRHLKVFTNPARHHLHFRLTSGLERLANLRELQELRFNSSQHLAEDYVRWMVENWPRLESVFGILHPEKNIDSSLKRFLTERGVVTHMPNYDVRLG